MLELVIRMIFVSIIYGMIMYILDVEGKSFIAFRHTFRLLFLIMAIAIGSKLGIYIQ